MLINGMAINIMDDTAANSVRQNILNEQNAGDKEKSMNVTALAVKVDKIERKCCIISR
jgi:hypothetical protein